MPRWSKAVWTCGSSFRPAGAMTTSRGGSPSRCTRGWRGGSRQSGSSAPAVPSATSTWLRRRGCFAGCAHRCSSWRRNRSRSPRPSGWVPRAERGCPWACSSPRRWIVRSRGSCARPGAACCRVRRSWLRDLPQRRRSRPGGGLPVRSSCSPTASTRSMSGPCRRGRSRSPTSAGSWRRRGSRTSSPRCTCWVAPRGSSSRGRVRSAPRSGVRGRRWSRSARCPMTASATCTRWRTCSASRAARRRRGRSSSGA